jgi:hypothetical protein
MFQIFTFVGIENWISEMNFEIDIIKIGVVQS